MEIVLIICLAMCTGLQQIKILSLSTYIVKKNLSPSDEELRQCTEYVVKKIFKLK